MHFSIISNLFLVSELKFTHTTLIIFLSQHTPECFTLINDLSLQEALSDVADWLEHHTNEVVIISLSAFEDITPVQHSILIGFLMQLFGKKLCPKSVSSCIFLVLKCVSLLTSSLSCVSSLRKRLL